MNLNNKEGHTLYLRQQSLLCISQLLKNADESPVMSVSPKGQGNLKNWIFFCQSFQILRHFAYEIKYIWLLIEDDYGPSAEDKDELSIRITSPGEKVIPWQRDT